MLTSFLIALVSFCRSYAKQMAGGFLLLTLLLGWFVSTHIKINTDIDQLMGDGLAWRNNEKDLAQAFPQNSDRLVIVVDGASADTTEHAATLLASELLKQKELFKTVKRPDAIPFFRKNGFLFLSEEKLSDHLDNMVKAQPMLGSLAKDPTLRGLFSTLALTVDGVVRGEATYEQIEPALLAITKTLKDNLSTHTSYLAWQSLMSDAKPSLRDTRKYIITQPELDFSALSPGKKASKAIRALVAKHELTKENGFSVRLTGSVALNDEEFASVADGTGMATILAFVLVMTLLFLALKSARLIVPIILTLLSGLIATTAFAMATIGSLNLISVAFAVMFVGIAVDFGIQFSVRFREAMHTEKNAREAIEYTAKTIAGPLAFAAAATILGFMAFIPTDYRGVSELGIIAAAGMAIAFILNLTLLPALLTLFKPQAEPEAIAYSWAKPIDSFLQKNRKRLQIITVIIAVLGTGIASQARFDFDPLNLKDPETESVSTLFDIMKDPEASPYTIEILAPDLKEAQALAAQIEKRPEVSHTITLASFVPDNQEQKLALIEDAAFLLEPSLNPPSVRMHPSDEDVYLAMRSTINKLRDMGIDKPATTPLVDLLTEIMKKRDHKLVLKLDTALLSGMKSTLNQLKDLIKAEPISDNSLSDDLRNDWIAKDGRAKIVVYPNGDARDHNILIKFTAAVREIAPNASGAPISIQESGKTVRNAFIQAGIFALIAVALLGFIVLRRPMDVLRLILPLILAGILTLATMVIINLPLNFANVIALPLLLSLGVTYAIYFITYCKNGNEGILHSAMARAVLFSAGTTLVAFGSLSLSSHLGTSGMGELLTIALVYSALSTFLVLPLLLDPSPSGKG